MRSMTLFAAALGLSFLVPASTAVVNPAGAASPQPFLLAQKASKEDGEKERARRQGRGGEDEKDKAGRQGRDEGKGKDSGSAERDKAAAEKARREAAEKAAREAREKAAAEAKAKEEREKAAREAREKAAAEAKAKAERERQQAQERERERAKQQSQDRDRGERRDRADRRRRGSDEERQARDRAQQREKQRTSAQDLSKIQIQPDRGITIDGGRRTLEREGNRVVIRTDDTSRFANRGKQRGNERSERLPNGQTRTIVIYPDGTQIITVTDARGRVIHRSRRDRGGREIVLIRELQRAPLLQIDLGPLRLTIPREQYIVDSRRASRADLQRVLWASPVERVDRIYSVDEVRRFDRVRDIMPRLDFQSITFDTDSAFISPEQVDMLADIADIIIEMIDRNPAEMILIEGHTDAPGSNVYNLALSERRAEAVAIALTDYFDVPPENLVTQGYGEEYPKIPTELAERENRRVAFRRITPLVSEYGR